MQPALLHFSSRFGNTVVAHGKLTGMLHFVPGGMLGNALHEEQRS